MTSTTILRTAVATALAASLAACSTHEHATPPPPVAATAVTKEEGTVRRSDVVTAQATVVGIDRKKRLVTLRGHDGEDFTIRADESVKNFAQIRKGDEVTATYYRAIAARVRKPGEATPGITTGEQLQTAEPGQKPAGAGARTVQVTATVTKIDRDAGEITLRGPRGRSVAVAVRDRSNLDRVKKGDLVEVTYTEAVAISVEKPAR
jgi:Cu/Ag efflux protein CusF